MKTNTIISLTLGAFFAFVAPIVTRGGTNDLVADAGGFVGQLERGDFAAAVGRFDPTMKKAAPEPKLREIWQGAQAQFGTFRRQVRTRSEKQFGYDMVFLTCQFERALMDIKVVFDAQGRIAGLFFVPPRDEAVLTAPPPYANTNAFREKRVTVGQGEWSLSGTLTVPSTAVGARPAVVLVHGSGPNDRDETIGANKPFRDLAWGLASKGIVVLRYEKRTKEHATQVRQVMAGLTLREETVDDAVAAADLLRRTGGVDPKRVFVLGHSLGGMAAPRIGKADPALAGLIVLAGSTRALEDIIVEQTRYLVSASGQDSPEAKAKLAETEAAMAKVKKLTLADATSSTPIFGACPAYWLDLRAYDPAGTARSLHLPMLILQGARDYQVTTADFDGWKAALDSRPSVSFKLYPDLNHLFITGKGKSTPAEYEQAGHVAEAVVADIAEWIAGH